MDMATSDPAPAGKPVRHAAEQKQILNYITNLAYSFAQSVKDIELDEHDLFALGLRQVVNKIDRFTPRSQDDNKVTRAFKAWISTTCRHKWIDELNKTRSRINYQAIHYKTGDYDEDEQTLEIPDPVDMDELVINADNRSLMRQVLRNVLDEIPEYRAEAIMDYRSLRKGRKGSRGFQGETASIAQDAGITPELIRKWSSRLEKTCLDRYRQETQNVKRDQTSSRPRSG